MTELTYTVEEAGRLCGVSRGAAYQAVRSGDIPSVRIGRRLLVPRARLLALLGEQSFLPPNANEPAANRLDGKTPEDARHAPS
jgi:excisionase family DNA binding protein